VATVSRAAVDRDRASRRPVLVVQGNAFNRSRISTVVVVPLMRKLGLTEAPGNVLFAAHITGYRTIRSPTRLRLSASTASCSKNWWAR
jgi:mRNA-degrading endonuclease toxin of MazEF toxin-antitoxin module